MKSRVAYLFFATLCLAGCANRTSTNTFTQLPFHEVDQFPGSCPYLATGPDGRIYLSWVRQTGDSSYVFCYASSSDEGKTFSPAIFIPGSDNVHPHAENLPKIISKPSGELLAVWGAANPDPRNPYAGLIYYAQSFDDGKSWTPAERLVKDTAGFDQRYFDVDLLSNGEAAITWLDNRKDTTKQGSALFFAVTHGRKGFVEERRVAQPCCECCRVDMLRDGNNMHILFRGIIDDSIRDMLHTVSFDGGEHFSKPEKISRDNWIINGCPHSGPSMARAEHGVAFAWFTGGGPSGVYFASTPDNGKTFTERTIVSSRGRHPQMVWLQDGELIVSFDEMVDAGDQVFYRIGMERRSAGNKKNITYVTADSISAAYPVTAPVSHGLLLACTIHRGKQTFIGYKTLPLF